MTEAAQSGERQAGAHHAATHPSVVPLRRSPAAPAETSSVDTSSEYALPPLPVASSITKRLFDILVASSALLVFLPLLVMIAMLIRLDAPGPALFRQRRTGLGGKVFTIYKLRTMTVVEDAGEVRQATKNDIRVTQIGGILRKLSLDELPQLFNVLVGDMSIVGPRPHAIAHDAFYGERIPTYGERFRARPGLTGFAQISGFRGEVRELKQMADRISADNAYIDRWSLGLDVMITFKTLPLMLRDPNAY
ncbi:sugar transferase [Phenylobacterium sp.]|uniref:sugar transferase n=1 Tax=Phenylobacterium sp. TaxID=1871053 RepID=UPI002736CA15|nr:sugar transferase [Phenylobacterium sp.]MDP3853502.1 sugar transferase [Phenylobacterium sp.]